VGDCLAYHWRESYVAETGKSMKVPGERHISLLLPELFVVSAPEHSIQLTR